MTTILNVNKNKINDMTSVRLCLKEQRETVIILNARYSRTYLVSKLDSTTCSKEFSRIDMLKINLRLAAPVFG